MRTYNTWTWKRVLYANFVKHPTVVCCNENSQTQRFVRVLHESCSIVFHLVQTVFHTRFNRRRSSVSSRHVAPLPLKIYLHLKKSFDTIHAIFDTVQVIKTLRPKPKSVMTVDRSSRAVFSHFFHGENETTLSNYQIYMRCSDAI